MNTLCTVVLAVRAPVFVPNPLSVTPSTLLQFSCSPASKYIQLVRRGHA